MPSLAALAAETVAVLNAGRYVSPGGRTIELAPLIEAARAGTCLFTPAELQRLGAEAGPLPGASGVPRIEVSAETTAQACRRLVEADGVAPAALNFASARNPGGGFLGNAKAQEEDLARASALYACLVTQMEYYEANRREASLLYTDHIIYSPAVPFFRDDRLAFLESPFCASIITAPAPNAGEVLKRDPEAQPSIRATLELRAHHVLRIAAVKGHRCLVLGAWGCGVFRNDPAEVADLFALGLAHASFQGLFDRVVFAIYDRTADQRTLRAFEDRFPAQA